jgi:hypothetical protein
VIFESETRTPTQLENLSPRSTLGVMRRILAILLLALFSFSLVSPAVFASDADSKLSPCCRRNGKHHCEMIASRSAASSGPTIETGKCPSFPGTQAVPAQQNIGLLKVSEAVFGAVVSHPASRPQVEALCRISNSRAGQKRGPPPLLA